MQKSIKYTMEKFARNLNLFLNFCPNKNPRRWSKGANTVVYAYITWIYVLKVRNNRPQRASNIFLTEKIAKNTPFFTYLEAKSRWNRAEKAIFRSHNTKYRIHFPNKLV